MKKLLKIIIIFWVLFPVIIFAEAMNFDSSKKQVNNYINNTVFSD